MPEGALTEKSYMEIFKSFVSDYSLHVVLCKSTRSAIKHLLQQANENLENLRPNDEIWILVDRDREAHTEEQFRLLYKWVKADEQQRHLAISNPRFEYWLLWHFVEMPSSEDASSDTKLDQYLPGYSKSKNLAKFKEKFTRQRIQTAIDRAYRQKEFPDCDHLECRGSGVAVLINKILNFH